MKLLTLFALSALAFGCSESVESTDIRTTGIYPEIVVTATGDGTSLVEVQLKTGGANSDTFLDLRGDDTLEVTVGEETKTMDGTSDNKYRASFSVDAEDTEFVIAFLRGDQDDDAPASTVTLPAPFELAIEGTEFSRATDDVNFTWDPPASGNVTWETDGDCIIGDDDDTPDDGAETIAAGSIETFDSEKEETCTVDLDVTRSRRGTIDPAFTEGGRIVARQVRRQSFSSAP